MVPSAGTLAASDLSDRVSPAKPLGACLQLRAQTAQTALREPREAVRRAPAAQPSDLSDRVSPAEPLGGRLQLSARGDSGSRSQARLAGRGRLQLERRRSCLAGSPRLSRDVRESQARSPSGLRVRVAVIPARLLLRREIRAADRSPPQPPGMGLGSGSCPGAAAAGKLPDLAADKATSSPGSARLGAPTSLRAASQLLSAGQRAGKPGAAGTWGWKPHLPTATASRTCHPGGALALEKQQARSSCSCTPAATRPGAGGSWKAASSHGSCGPRTRGAASIALTPRVWSTLSTLEAAGLERGSQRWPREDWHAGLRVPHAGPAAPHLSAAAGIPAAAPRVGCWDPGVLAGRTSASCLGPCSPSCC
ncbi:rabphilin-3A-like [Rhinopithecus roxellana]|uniref:rabphilin-3A-like n=1 Tax=Rhinopithecus roxellana TaxID=61622 RepID=UPI001237396E|nr:rabphilin-3A-like [Rhinopithecus roxellana]